MQDETVRSGSGIEMVKSIWGRRKWLAILVFIVPFVIAVSLITFMPSLYRSTATILVDRQQVPESMVRPTVTSALETRLHTISQEILSRSRLDALIRQFNLYADLRRNVSLEDLIQRMRADIKLELKSVEQSNEDRRTTISFTLSYAGRNPELVARVTNTLASFYIEENLKARERQATGTAEFLKVQLADVKKRLDAQEAIVSEFKKRYMGELPQQTDANLNAIERLSMQLRLNGDNQARAVERREALARQLSDAASLSPAAAGPESRVDRLSRLQQDLRSLRSTYSDKYPDIARLKHEIAELEREIASPDIAKENSDKATSALSPHVLRIKQSQAEVESDLNILRNEEKRLRNALASYLGRVQNSPEREKELRELSRDYDATREYYASLMKRYDDAQLAESMEQRQKGEQFRLIDAAVPASVPTAPNRLRLTLIMLGACLGLAIGAVLVAEQINPSFHSVDDLRALTTVPVLLSIPLIVTPDDTRRGTRRLRMAAAGAAIGLVVLVGVSFFVAHDNDQLVMLVTRGKA
jgi:polysaccharide chain length determinant protein (PEP-CTERM system associated)